LQRESAHAAAAGDYYRAIALLERAIRIQPADPQLWLDLARVHLRQGAHPEAEQFARKALSLTRGNYTLEQDAWVLIDQARGHGAGTSP
jgi:Flp pilus assembly protein TadD